MLGIVFIPVSDRLRLRLPVCYLSIFFRWRSGVLTNYSGFQSTIRGNTLAQKILAADIAQGLNRSSSLYAPDYCEPYMQSPF
jgi:hypothetical protein